METKQINTGTYKLERGELVVSKAPAGGAVLAIHLDGYPVQTVKLNENGFQIVEDTAKSAPAAVKVTPVEAVGPAREVHVEVVDAPADPADESERRVPRRRF